MIYAIGDIHGQHTMLRALLIKVIELPLRPEDTVIFLGDYVDRGEDARGVLDTLLQWREQHPTTVFLRGNHEQFMLDAYEDDTTPETALEQAARVQKMLVWLQNGGVETLLSYAPAGFREWCESVGYALTHIPAAQWADFKASFTRWLETIPLPHWEFLQATQMEYVTPQYHFVHAGLLPPGTTWESEGWTIDPRLWIREPFLSSRADFDGRIVVFGHTPQRKGRPLVQSNKIGLDTGAVFGGPLTAGLFEASPDSTESLAPRFLQVPHTRASSPSQGDSTRSAPARPRASSARSSRK